MVNYQLGKIYKITDVGRTKMYIGSTTKDYVSKRMVEHRNAYYYFKAGSKKGHRKISVFELFDEFGIENCIIELIETCPCNNRDELHRREGELIKASECVNKNIAGRTLQEYYEENKDKINEKRRAYIAEHYEENKDKINEKR